MGSTSYLTLVAILTVVAALKVPAAAQEIPAQAPVQAQPPQSQAEPPQPPDVDSRRFTLYRVDGGFLRLDLRTGAVASCSPNGADWTCLPARDERAALDREIARLQQDNARLKNALLEHGVPLPDNMAPAPPGSAGSETIPRPPQTVPPTSSPPSAASRDDAEFERVITVVEKAWRRLVEVMTNVQRDLEKKDLQKKE